MMKTIDRLIDWWIDVAGNAQVRMNDMLSYLLTYKLKGEDAIRSSGIPATIIRPCALTEEAAGAPMIVAQGDDIKGKISRCGVIVDYDRMR